MIRHVNEAAVRRYEPADRAAVREVLDACYGPSAERDAVYEWWNERFPGAGTGFMVAEVRGRLVGAQPMNIGTWATPERELTGGLLTGVVVHPDFRRRGLFSMLVAACEEEAWRRGADFVLTMPNERSFPGFLKRGYVDLGRRTLMTALLDGRCLFGSPGRVLNLAVRREVQWADSRIVEVLPPDIDELMTRGCPPETGLSLRRSGAWLRWRYEGAPSRRYCLAESRDQDGLLTGLAVGAYRAHRGRLIGYVMELLYQNREVARSLLSTLSRELVGLGVGALAAIASSPEMLRTLREAGLHRVPDWLPLKRFLTVIRLRPEGDPSLVADLGQLQNWSFMLGDWDNL